MGWWGVLMKNNLLYDNQQKSSRTTFSYRTLRSPTKTNTEPDRARQNQILNHIEPFTAFGGFVQSFGFDVVRTQREL